LAADLHAFVAGARVSAHDYSAVALVRRWVARRRAAVAATAAALLAIALAAAVGVRSVVAERDRAERQRVRAERERAAAIANRAAADALVAFVMHDLRARLAPIGRLDVLAGVDAAVEAYQAAARRAP